jgi:hypothetical protein
MINLSDLEKTILSSSTGKIILRNALKKVMLTNFYISNIDSISLINFICDLYKIEDKEFDDITLKDIKILGYKILED